MFCCCKKYPESWTPNSCSRRNFQRDGFASLGSLLARNCVKAAVILFTLTLLAFSCYGMSRLQVKFRYLDFLPDESSIRKWFSLHEEYFPAKEDDMGRVYLADLDLPSDLGKIGALTELLNARPDIISEVRSWYPLYRDYVETNVGPLNEQAENFPRLLTQFLFSPKGSALKFPKKIQIKIINNHFFTFLIKIYLN